MYHLLLNSLFIHFYSDSPIEGWTWWYIYIYIYICVYVCVCVCVFFFFFLFSSRCECHKYFHFKILLYITIYLQLNGHFFPFSVWWLCIPHEYLSNELLFRIWYFSGLYICSVVVSSSFYSKIYSFSFILLYMGERRSCFQSIFLKSRKCSNIYPVEHDKPKRNCYITSCQLGYLKFPVFEKMLSSDVRCEWNEWIIINEYWIFLTQCKENGCLA